MKYIKSYKLFESVYSIEEYFDYITKGLCDHNIRPVDLNQVMSNYELDIMDCYDSGQNPKIILDQILKDLELSDGGFMNIKQPKSNKSIIKYL
jgi:hypothetical protein